MVHYHNNTLVDCSSCIKRIVWKALTAIKNQTPFYAVGHSLATYIQPPIYSHLYTATYIQPPIYSHLCTATYVQPPIYSHLCTATYIQPPIYSHLYTATYVQPPIYSHLQYTIYSHLYTATYITATYITATYIQPPTVHTAAHILLIITCTFFNER